jgi:hypothetical protein
MSRKIFNIKKMNKTTSIFVGVLFSTLVLASCGGKKDEATPEAGAKTEGPAAPADDKTPPADAPAANETAAPAADAPAADETAAPAEGAKPE